MKSAEKPSMSLRMTRSASTQATVLLTLTLGLVGLVALALDNVSRDHDRVLCGNLRLESLEGNLFRGLGLRQGRVQRRMHLWALVFWNQLRSRAHRGSAFLDPQWRHAAVDYAVAHDLDCVVVVARDECSTLRLDAVPRPLARIGHDVNRRHNVKRIVPGGVELLVGSFGLEDSVLLSSCHLWLRGGRNRTWWSSRGLDGRPTTGT